MQAWLPPSHPAILGAGFYKDDEENRVNVTTGVSTVRVRRFTLLGLIALELVLLYLLTAGILFRFTLNQSGLLMGGNALTQLVLVGLPSIVAFILPSAIGALARSWQGAIALAVSPWWLVIVLHAGTLLHATETSPYQPTWLYFGNAASLLVSLALFMALGFLCWLARHIVPEMV